MKLRKTSGLFPTMRASYFNLAAACKSLQSWQVEVYCPRQSWQKYLGLRQNSGMDRPAVIQTYGSVWITCVLVWIGGMDRPVGSGYGSGLYILNSSHLQTLSRVIVWVQCRLGCRPEPETTTRTPPVHRSAMDTFSFSSFIWGLSKIMVPENCPYAALSRTFRSLSRPSRIGTWDYDRVFVYL